MSNPYVDITNNKHGNNEQSRQANIEISPFKITWRERILGFVALRDQQGLGTSLAHAAEHFGKERGQISGRFSELKRDGLIEETRVVENGFMVYRVANSQKVAIVSKEKVARKRLLVVGPGLAGEIVFEKGTGGWQIAKITPNLKSILAETPVSDIGSRLTEKKLTYTWVGA